MLDKVFDIVCKHYLDEITTAEALIMISDLRGKGDKRINDIDRILKESKVNCEPAGRTLGKLVAYLY